MPWLGSLKLQAFQKLQGLIFWMRRIWMRRIDLQDFL